MIHFDKERNEIVDDTGKNVTDEAIMSVCNMVHEIQRTKNFTAANDLLLLYGIEINIHFQDKGFFGNPFLRALASCDLGLKKKYWEPKDGE